MADCPDVSHRCVPPFISRTRDCDCTRCCSAAPHQPGCNSILEEHECICPEESDYHLEDCPADPDLTTEEQW